MIMRGNEERVLEELDQQEGSIKGMLDALGIKRSTYDAFIRRNEDLREQIEEIRSRYKEVQTKEKEFKSSYPLKDTLLGAVVDIEALTDAQKYKLQKTFLLSYREYNLNTGKALAENFLDRSDYLHYRKEDKQFDQACNNIEWDFLDNFVESHRELIKANATVGKAFVTENLSSRWRKYRDAQKQNH